MTNNAEMQIRSRISVAPMMDWTDRHCRYFMRLISPGARLYTEMLTAAAVEHGDRDKLLGFDSSEHPVAAQLGGSDPDQMAAAAAICAAVGYDEININIGCPSDRVQSGQFGACLMANPGLVATCFSAMQAASDVPVTVKTRIGIDDDDNYEYLVRFVDAVANAGCRIFVVHARIAILSGLSPKENRTVPPLDHERVYRLKRDFPELTIVLNGGIAELSDVEVAMQHVDGVMIGRRAYHDPYFLAEIEHRFISGRALPDRSALVQEMMPYVEAQLVRGERLNRITRHMLGLFANQPGARAWRRYLSENAHLPGAGPEILQRALDAIPEAA
ncbi:MAG TPA: tRNA dihydrouridine(20/20a) synthase DusA [Woeseiaceae bacterium]|nr:tRNA dihydrouridine(20/20a) synthase DusA [Woeseiaceae bacterium]